MTNYSTLSYGELQAEAKAHGIRANQSKEVLIAELERLQQGVESSSITLTPEQLQEIVAQQVAQALATQQPVVHKPQPKAEDVSESSEVTSAWGAIMNAPREAKQRDNYQYATEFPISEGQMKFITDLYARHRLDTSVLATMSRAEIRAEIDRLRYADLPASDKQLDLIRTTVAEINEIASNPFVPEDLRTKGMNLHIKESVLLKLTGGQEGTAGALIDKLFAMRKQYSPYRPLSDKQADLLVKWFFCPDVPFEQFGINKKIGNVYMTPEQFKEELLSKMLNANASKLIDDYMPIVTEWERSRCSSQQRAYIRKLEARMADLSTGSAVEWAVNEDGEMVQVQKKSAKEYNPTAYEFMPEEYLIMMSKDDAEKYIQQLRLELSRPKKGAIQNDPNQQLLEDKRAHSSHKEVNSRLKEKEQIIDFLFKLEAVVGYDNSELRDEVDELLVHGIGSMQGVTKQIQDFIDLALDMNAIKIENLVELGQNSQVISSIIKVSYPLEYDQAIHGKREDDADNHVVYNEAKEEVPKKTDSEVEDLLNSL
jgi:hypothetical protein